MGAAMRGSDALTGALFSYVDLEDRVPADHPLRVIRAVVNEVLRALDADFGAMYSDFGRQSIPPERLLRGSLIQAFYTVRSERQLMEQLDYNLLFRWFVGLGIDDPVWDHSTYSKNRDRLLEADIAKKFLAAILAHSQVAPLLSDDHFTVDGTMVQRVGVDEELSAAGATGAEPTRRPIRAARRLPNYCRSPPSAGPPPETGSNIEPDAALPATPSTTEAAPMTTDTATKPKKSRNAEVDFHGQKRSNATHASVTDLQARLYKKGKGKEAKLSYIGHAMTENRHGLVVQTEMTQATGKAEREAAKLMIEAHDPGSERRITVGADKGYDTADFVADLRAMCVTPHVAQNNKGRASAIDARTTRHPGYAISQKKRKLVEEPFGWGKTIGGLARPMRRGTPRMGFVFTFTMAAYDLIRLPRIFANATA